MGIGKIVSLLGKAVVAGVAALAISGCNKEQPKPKQVVYPIENVVRESQGEKLYKFACKKQDELNVRRDETEKEFRKLPGNIAKIIDDDTRRYGTAKFLWNPGNEKKEIPVYVSALEKSLIFYQADPSAESYGREIGRVDLKMGHHEKIVNSPNKIERRMYDFEIPRMLTTVNYLGESDVDNDNANELILSVLVANEDKEKQSPSPLETYCDNIYAIKCDNEGKLSAKYVYGWERPETSPYDLGYTDARCFENVDFFEAEDLDFDGDKDIVIGGRRHYPAKSTVHHYIVCELFALLNKHGRYERTNLYKQSFSPVSPGYSSSARIFPCFMSITGHEVNYKFKAEGFMLYVLESRPTFTPSNSFGESLYLGDECRFRLITIGSTQPDTIMANDRATDYFKPK